MEKIDDRICQILDDMAETLYDSGGVGLAAPQVGILRRIVVIDIGEGLIELINPEIIETDGIQVGDEGCLSIPGKSGEVPRPNYVKVKAVSYTHLVVIDRFYPSSQLCSDCGIKWDGTKDLAVRQWTCPACGSIHDRDVNAAKNILNEGLRLLA